LIAEINYGGRVTDDKDMRLIKAILGNYFSEIVVTKENYKFSESGIYYSPSDMSLEGIKNYIK